MSQKQNENKAEYILPSSKGLSKDAYEDKLLQEVRNLWKLKNERKINQEIYNAKIAKLREYFKKQSTEKVVIFERYKTEIEKTKTSARMSHIELKSAIFKQIADSKMNFFRTQIASAKDFKRMAEKELKSWNFLEYIWKTSKNTYQEWLNRDISQITEQMRQFRMILNQNRNDPNYSKYEQEFKKYIEEFKKLNWNKEVVWTSMKDATLNSAKEAGQNIVNWESIKVLYHYSVGIAEGTLKTVKTVLNPMTYVNMVQWIAYIASQTKEILEKWWIKMLWSEFNKIIRTTWDKIAENIEKFKDLPPEKMSREIGNIVSEVVTSIYWWSALMKVWWKIKRVSRWFKIAETAGMDTEVVVWMRRWKDVINTIKEGRMTSISKQAAKNATKQAAWEVWFFDSVAAKTSSAIDEIWTFAKTWRKVIDETIDFWAPKTMKSPWKIANQVIKWTEITSNKAAKIAGNIISGSAKLATTASAGAIWTAIKEVAYWSWALIAAKTAKDTWEQSEKRMITEVKPSYKQNEIYEAHYSAAINGSDSVYIPKHFSSRENRQIFYDVMFKVLDKPWNHTKDVIIGNNLKITLKSEWNWKYSINYWWNSGISHTWLTRWEIRNAVSFATYSNKMGLAFLLPRSFDVMKKINKSGWEINNLDWLNAKEKKRILNGVWIAIFWEWMKETTLDNAEKKFKNIKNYTQAIKDKTPKLKKHIWDFESIEEVAKAKFPNDNNTWINFDKFIRAIG